MWIVNKDTNKWIQKQDSLNVDDFESLKQDLSSLRFYQKVLSGTTYVSTDNEDDIYDIVNHYDERTYNYTSLFSPYVTPYFNSIPNQVQISSTASQIEFLEKFIPEYGLTLKNLFTPDRLIKDQLKNLLYVDIATTDILLNLNDFIPNFIIDGITLIEGHRVLVKDQYDLITIPTTTNPDTFFAGNYQVSETIGSNTTYLVYNSQNGIYTYKDNRLVRTEDLDTYENLIKYSVCVKLGINNRETQWSLQRLRNGFYPNYIDNNPIYFVERKNWVLRNQIDYNNLFELVLNDTLKHGTQSILDNGIIYTIPERTLSIGEFGIIFNHQEGYTNIITTKYKIKLNSITQNSKYYWICGEDGLLLKVSKINFNIERVNLEEIIAQEGATRDPRVFQDNSNKNKVLTSLKSVSFFNDLRGVVVGKFNQIWITNNGGNIWKRINIVDFEKFNFNVVFYSKLDTFYVGGDNGVFIEFSYNSGNWTAYKRRISKYEEVDDEFLLVDDITGIKQFSATMSNFFTSSHSFLAISCTNNNLYLYDESNILSTGRENSYDFINISYNALIGDLSSVTYLDSTSNLYVSNFESILQIDPFSGTFSNNFSNILTSTFSNFLTQSGINKLFNYNNEIVYTGINSLWRNIDEFGNVTEVYDSNFFSGLKPRLLFMDYDAGSKVYWFDDFGQYRLPDKLIVPVSYLIDPSALTETFISFRQNTNSTFNSITGITNSYIESNWITYWKDRLKTFEYYTHIGESFKVEPSFDFRSSNYLSGNFKYTSSDITTIYSNFQELMPSTESRFRELSTPISAPSMDRDLYFHKFLGIWTIKIPSSENGPQKGDVIKIDSNVVKGKFIINKVVSFDDGMGETTHYQYFYTDFNENIINNLNGFTGDLNITNLNVYSVSTGGVKNFTFTSGTGYINGSYENIESITSGTGSSATFNIEINGAGNITSLSINNAGFGYNIGDLITLQSGGVFGGNTDISINVIELDYTSLFLDNFKKHYISYGYEISEILEDYPKPESSPLGLTQSFQISGKYSQYSAYYNLQSNVEILNTSGLLTEEEILYPKGFLNFGYTPTYNLLSYLNFIDDSKYNPDKEFLSLPKYDNIPGPDSGIPDTNIVNDNIIYMDFVTGQYSGQLETNKLFFGINLKPIWDSFFKWTFVNITLKEDNIGPIFNTDRLLIIDKYYDEETYDEPYYVIEFHDRISGNNNIKFVSIHSRRTLQQISDDLQYVNRIQRPQWLTTVVEPGYSFNSYETDINFKIPTDSYTKALLSDSDIVKDVTGIIYTDYKNDLALQITKLSKRFRFRPTAVIQSLNANYQIAFPERHGLKDGEGVIIEIVGTQSNFPFLLGYHPVRYINDFNVELPITWSGFVPSDTLDVTFVKQDPFLNFQPVDIFDIGIGDKKVKQSVEITTDKYDIENSRYFLKDINYRKYRFRLIDGLDLEKLTQLFPWILDAEISNAIIGIDNDGNLVWYRGIWEGGRWFGGTWISGTWKSGDWYAGKWTSKLTSDNLLSVKFDKNQTNKYSSKWFGGRWFGGTWENGTWYSGRWYGGEWLNGDWFDGTWNDGNWNNGNFLGGLWVLGTWYNGIFNTDSKLSYWLDGKFLGGDFENGFWFNGEFNELENTNSRFGVKSSNSRNSVWYGGRFLNGEFHSFLNLDDQNSPTVSEIHKYSKWYSGFFNGGVFYGGDVYNINFNSAIWQGGILNDIDIISIKSNLNNNSFVLDGIYRFNINDEFFIVDNFTANTYSVFGTTENPKKYRILKITIDENSNTTELFVDVLLSSILSVNTGVVDTNLKCVSIFRNSTWNSGIWFNGVFSGGYFNGGIWYNGNFSGIWG
jgi:hypothetical protein